MFSAAESALFKNCMVVLSITTSEKHDWEAFVRALFVEGCGVCADIDVGEKMCTCLGNRASAVSRVLCLHISGMNFDHRQILASKHANAQPVLLPGTFSTTNSSVIKLMEISSSFLTPRAFRQQSMVPRCENQSHGLLRYLVHLFCHKVHRQCGCFGLRNV